MRRAIGFAKGVKFAAIRRIFWSMIRAERISARLRDRLHPTLLRVIDDSHKHAGHAGASPSGETHYSLFIVADAFTGQSRIARARLVHDALASEFASGLHAISLSLHTIKEYVAAGN